MNTNDNPLPSVAEKLEPFKERGVSQEEALATWRDLNFAENPQSTQMEAVIKATFEPTPNMEVEPYGVVDGVDYDAPKEEEPLEASPTISELWEAATYRHHISNAMNRNIKAIEGYDPDYRVTTEELIKYNDQGYTDEEIIFLSKSVSSENFGYRVDRIAADREAKQVIEQGGMEGTGIEMLASITDPVLIPTLFLGGTVAAGAKWRSAKAIGASMLSGASQNVAAEYLLKTGDTQRTDEDLILAASMGALFSGTITAGALGYKNVKLRRAQANQIEAPHVDGVRAAMDGDIYNKADAALATENASSVNRKRVLSEKEIIAKLQEEVVVSTSPKKGVGAQRETTLSPKKIKAAKQEFRDYRKGQNKKIDAVKKSLLRPKAKNNQVEQLQASINRREQELNVLIADNNTKLATNSNLDALQQGKIPKELQERYNTLKKEAGEMTPEPQKNLGKGLPPKPPKPVDENGVELPEERSIGAMQTRTVFKDIKTYDSLLAETEIDGILDAVNSASELGQSIPRISRMATKVPFFRSLSTRLDMAGDDATRGINAQLFKSGIRTIEGHHAAEELADTLNHKHDTDFMYQEEAFEEYLASKGIPWHANTEAARQEFNKLVVLHQGTHEINGNAYVKEDSPIIKAAKARSRIYERSLNNRKEYDVVGFDKIEHSHSYHSVIYNSSMILGKDVHRDYVVDVIAKSYQTGGIKLSRENALALAEAQLQRTFARSGGHKYYNKVLSEAEYKRLDKELEEAGVDATTRSELKNSLFNKEEIENMTPRAMFSLKPNLTAVSGDVRLVDLLDTSMERVMKYAFESSGDAGIASHGYKSRTQLLRAIEEARLDALRELDLDARSSNPKIAKQAKKLLAEADSGKLQQMMEDGISLIYKEPLKGATNDTLEDLSKVMRKQTTITRLRSSGIMSLPENAIAMHRVGAMNFIRNIPQARYFDLRRNSIEGDKFMKDYANALSSTGHQEALFDAKFFNNSEFDDATKSRLMKLITKYQGKGLSATMTLNGFRSIQHGGEEATARSIISNLKELSVKGEITPNIRKSLIKVGGMSEEQIDEMISHFAARPDVDIFDSIRQMPPKLNNTLSVATRNTISSSFMRMGIGESVPYANRELGKIMTSLLTFSIGSWEKMVVRGFKADGKALTLSMFASQAALGLIGQYAYVHSRASKMEGSERDKYIEKNLEDEGLFWGVMNRIGFLAAPMIPLQIISNTPMMPEFMKATPTKAGISESGLPSYDMASDAKQAVGSAASLMYNQVSGEYVPDEETERKWNKIRRATPWIDSLGYNIATGVFD